MPVGTMAFDNIDPINYLQQKKNFFQTPNSDVEDDERESDL